MTFRRARDALAVELLQPSTLLRSLLCLTRKFADACPVASLDLMAVGKKASPFQKTDGEAKKAGKKGKTRLQPETAVETTIHLAKFLKGKVWKRRAPLSIDVVKRAAKKIMHTEDVRVDSKLNEYLWSQGIKGVPRRVRVMLRRKRSTDEKDVRLLRTPTLLPSYSLYAY